MLGQCQSLLACSDHLAGIPRIDPQRSQQYSAAARELTHDDHTCLLLVVVVRSDEFKRHQVQTSLHAGVQQHVRRPEEREALGALHLLHAEVDVAISAATSTVGVLGHDFYAALPVTLQERVRLRSQGIHQRGHSLVRCRRLDAVLDQHRLPPVVGVLPQKPLESPELRDKATEVVAPVHAGKDGLALKEGLDLHGLACHSIAKNQLLGRLVRVWEVGHLEHDQPAVVVQAHETACTEGGVKPVDAFGTNKETPGVGEELEAQLVGAKHAREQLLPDGQGLEAV
mmetsp:Transcript_41564/g.132228  ORF Transcript_41564/g.132228 Transcript_41564/m.132228 type:complete len:284 (+) Transcript_41564:1530-2381(+)